MPPYPPLCPVALDQARRPGGENNWRHKQGGWGVKANPELVVLSRRALMGLGLSDEYIRVELWTVVGISQPAGVDQLMNCDTQLHPVADPEQDLMTSEAGVNHGGAWYKDEGLDDLFYFFIVFPADYLGMSPHCATDDINRELISQDGETDLTSRGVEVHVRSS